MSSFWLWRAVGSDSTAGVNAAGAAQDARTARRDVDSLEMRLDRAMLACEAMWTLLRDKLGVTDLQLIERINEIDLKDGNLDGCVGKTPVSCPKCRRTLSPKFSRCMYCGQPIMQDPFA